MNTKKTTQRMYAIQKMYNLGYNCQVSADGKYHFIKGLPLNRYHITADTQSGVFYENHEWLNHKTGMVETEPMIINSREEEIIREVF